MADNYVDIYRDDVGYPYIRLRLDNFSTSGRTANSVKMHYRVTAWVNGYFNAPNYGGEWQIRWNNANGSVIASEFYVRPSTGYGSNNGKYVQIFEWSYTTTLTGLSATQTTATLCLRSYCANSAWTSLNFSRNFTISFAAGTIGVTGINISKSSWDAVVGQSIGLTANVTPSDATNKTINWSTTNAAVATVSNGTVTAKGPGTCTIRATAAGNTSKVASCTVTVITNKGPQGSLTPSSETRDGYFYVNNNTKYGMKVGDTFIHAVTVGGTDIHKVQVAGTKVWFKPVNKTAVITGNAFSRGGSLASNTSGGAATLAHCANAFSSNRANPIRPRMMRVSCNVTSFATAGALKTFTVKVFGYDSRNNNWCELNVWNNTFQMGAAYWTATGNLTISCDTPNFYTNFKFGIFGPGDLFLTSCYTNNITFISYDIDRSVES